MVTVIIEHCNLPPAELYSQISQILDGNAEFRFESDMPDFAPDSSRKKIVRLSSREQMVYELLSRGNSTKDIAKQLQVSPFTVTNQIRSIYRKIGVHSKGQAISYFFQSAE